MIMFQARNVKTLCSIIIMLVLHNYFEVDMLLLSFDIVFLRQSLHGCSSMIIMLHKILTFQARNYHHSIRVKINIEYNIMTCLVNRNRHH